MIKYLVLHGADPFKLKCHKTKKSAYELALQNQKDALKKIKHSSTDEKSPNDMIENKIIEVLINTKQ